MTMPLPVVVSTTADPTPAVKVPATLPGLALWLDGTLSAYSDAGVTLATTPLGRVQQMAQPAPLAGNWTAASSNARPWREANALDFHCSTPSTLVAPAPATPVPANNCTFAFAWHNRRGQGLFTAFSAVTTGAVFGFYITAGNLYLGTSAGYQHVAAFPNPSIVAGHLTVKCALQVTCTPTQYEIRMTVGSTTYTTVVAVAPVAGNLGTIRVGGSNPGDASLTPPIAISQFVAYSQALNSAQQVELHAYLLANVPGDPPITAPLIVYSGDSISAAWDPRVQASVESYGPRFINAGVAGAHTAAPAETPAFYQTDIKPYYSASRAKNILVCEGISVNDLAVFITQQGQNAATAAANVLTSYWAYCDQAKADGWIVVVCTLSPNLAGATYDAARAIINPAIRTDWALHGHYLADLGAAVGMATTADAANTALFYDGTHITSAGYLRWDDVLAPPLASALAA